MLIAGYATSKPKYRMWGSYAAIGLTILMIIGSFRGITTFLSGVGGKGEISGAAWLQVGVVILSLVFLLISLRVIFSRSKSRI